MHRSRFVRQFLILSLVLAAYAWAVVPAGYNSGGHLVPNATDGTNLINLHASQLVSGPIPYAVMPAGTAVHYSFRAPVALALTGLVTALAANSASNSFSGVTSPDLQRDIRVRMNSGWDGGNITVNGTDSNGAFSEVFTAGSGVTRASTRTYLTITSASKATVGASAATATIGPGDYFGIPVYRQLKLPSTSVGTVVTAAAAGGAPSLIRITDILNPSTGDPGVECSTVPDGARTYDITVALQ